MDVLTQATTTPVLVVPHPERPEFQRLAVRRPKSVMAMTDHLTGDHRLVNFAAHFTEAEGTLSLSHVEDDTTFERYMEAISKISTIDTDTARQEIRARLLKDPSDYIETCREGLAKSAPTLTVESVVTSGHHIREYQRLIEEHDVDLLVMNTKDEGQLAMHGLAYPWRSSCGRSRFCCSEASAYVISATTLQEAAGPTPEVSPVVTLLFAALLVAMIVCLAFEEKLHAKKSLIVGLFAVVALTRRGGTPFLALRPVPDRRTRGGPTRLHPGHRLGRHHDHPRREPVRGRHVALRPVHVDRYPADQGFAGDPVKLLWYYGLLTVAFSAVLNNVTAMIIVGSLSAVSLGKLERSHDLLGFLLIEGLLTNIGGLLTLISSVPNIIVGTAAGISFVAFSSRRPPSLSSSRWQRWSWGQGFSGFTCSRPPRRSRRRHSWSPASTSATASRVVRSSGSVR